MEDRKSRFSVSNFLSAILNLLSSILYLTVFTFSASALEVPPLRGRVNDLAGLMSATRVQALEERLARFEQEIGHQIAVLTIPSLEGEDIEGFGIKVAENWKIGKKGFDNGAVLIVAKNDRKLRIEVGYGLEGVLPDALASRIIREVIVPRFRVNDFAGGIEAGTDAIMRATLGEVILEQTRAGKGAPKGDDDYLSTVIFNVLFILVFVLFISLFLGLFSGSVVPGLARSAMKQRLTGGTIGGGLAAALASASPLGDSMPDWTIWLLLMIGLGALVGAGAMRVLWRGLTEARSTGAWSGSRYDRHSSRGGSSYSGSSWGSSSGGGGFSGGGGSFGGGGASGSW